jgi:hypothetical protein
MFFPQILKATLMSLTVTGQSLIWLLHQGGEISASCALEIIAISVIFQWKLPKKGAITLHFSEILVLKFFSTSIFSLAQSLCNKTLHFF